MTTPGTPVLDDELQHWISANAVPLPSGLPSADDLAFLADVLGDARIVQLGEASHSVGNGFALKARIVEFLHARLGFDVVIWEGVPGISGTRALAGAAPADPLATIRREGFWSSAVELEPLWEYALATRATSRPLDMIGYDAISTPEAIDRFGEGLRSFVGALPDAESREVLHRLADDALDASARIPDAVGDVPQGDVDAVIRTADALLAGLAEHRAALEEVHGAHEVAFAELAVQSLRTDGTGRAYRAEMGATGMAGAGFSRFWHERDVQAAKNLRWLIEDEYAGRKVIVWAHNVHVGNASVEPGFVGVRPGRHDDLMTPIGPAVAEAWGDHAYTIVLSHYDGEEGVAGTEYVSAVPAPPAESLEARLHVLGAPAAFVDVRPLDRQPEHPLRSPQSLRLITLGGSDGRYEVADVPALADGILFLARATPAVRRTTAD